MARRKTKPCDFVKSAQDAMVISDTMTNEEWEDMELRLDDLIRTTREKVREIRIEKDREYWKRMNEVNDSVLTLDLNSKRMFETIKQLREEIREKDSLIARLQH